jgi:hypothetical protein
MSNRKLVWILAMLAVALKPATGLADDDDQAPAEGRYFFDLLDHRSSFGKDFFIDSFLGPTLDSGTEIELDYLHGEKRGLHDDEVDTEVEWNPIGQLTIAGEFGWDSEHEQTPHAGLEGDNIDRGGEAGLEDVDIAVYHPIFQYVSKNGQVDYTAVVRVDVGIPTRGSPSSQDVLVTPFLGHMLRLGDHISLEAWTGPQITIAPHAANVLIYGACLGYVFPHKQFPVPMIDRLTPQIELDGQMPMSSAARESLFGVAGFDLGFRRVGEMQPHVALGYEFPIDQGARDQLRWGISLQIVFDF